MPSQGSYVEKRQAKGPKPSRALRSLLERLPRA